MRATSRRINRSCKKATIRFRRKLQALNAYIAREPEKFAAHAAVFILLICALYAIRRRVHPWVQEEPAIARAVRVLNAPVATALLLSILSGGWIYPEAPRLLWALFGVAALVPAVLIMRQLLEPYLFPILNALMVFFFVDRLRMISAALPLLSRFLFLAETAGGIVFLDLAFASRALGNNSRKRTRRALENHSYDAMKIALGIFCASVLANMLGLHGIVQAFGKFRPAQRISRGHSVCGAAGAGFVHAFCLARAALGASWAWCSAIKKRSGKTPAGF